MNTAINLIRRLQERTDEVLQVATEELEDKDNQIAFLTRIINEIDHCLGLGKGTHEARLHAIKAILEKGNERESSTPVLDRVLTALGDKAIVSFN